MRLANILAAALLIGSLSPAARASDLHIDIPVVMKEAKVVLNMDHLVYEGPIPTGLNYMTHISENFIENHTVWQMKAIFHGPAGYMLLNDAAYDRVRNWQGGNPYKESVAALMRDGVQIEECAETMAQHRWSNSDLLPNVKVVTGANYRIIQLVQDGYVQLQP